MRYQSINRLQDFDFHDAVWTLVSCSDNSLAGNVRFLNIHQDCPQNTEDCDMEIETARITMTGCRVIAYKPVSPEIIDSAGVRHPADPPVVYAGEKAAKALLNEMEYGMTFDSLHEGDNGSWILEGCGETLFFEAEIIFESVLVEWDSYRCPSWYVSRQRGIEA